MSARKVALHVGAMKTGTTFVQRMLTGNLELLDSRGIYYPQPWSDQVEAVRDALQLEGGSHLGSIEGRWNQMVDRLSAHEADRAILSVEFLSFANADQVRSLVESLRPSEVTVVIGARDLARVLPAQWQTAVRNGRQGTYRDYVKGVTGSGESRFKTHLWRRQDIGQIATRWAECIGRENVFVVTVPPSGSDPEILWRRMAEAMDLDGLELVDQTPTNESLGPTATELIRRINVQSQLDGMSKWSYQHGVNRALSHDVLPNLPDPLPHLSVPKSAHGWVRKQSERIVAEIGASGVRVVGTLDDLTPDLNKGAPSVWPEDIPDKDILKFAVAAMSAFSEQVAREKRAALRASSQDGDDQ